VNSAKSLNVGGMATVTRPVSAALRAAIVPMFCVWTSNSFETQAEFWRRQRAVITEFTWPEDTVTTATLSVAARS
jgi:hypothetical protein